MAQWCVRWTLDQVICVWALPRLFYFVIPPNSNTFSDWKRTSSKLTNSLRWTKLTNSLEKQQHELSAHTWSECVLWDHRNLWSIHCQANDFFTVVFYFWAGSCNKMLNSEFCCPSTTMSPSVLLRGTLMLSGKQNSLFPLGPVIKCLVFLSKTLDCKQSLFCSKIHSPLVCHARSHAHFPYGFSSKRQTARSLQDTWLAQCLSPVYKWIQEVNLMLGVTLLCTSIPTRGSRNIPRRFMLQKPG